jgi:hypothetical protein
LYSGIDGIYFDDGTLLGIASIVNGTGVSFDDPATPASLPAQNEATPAFVTTANFSASNTGNAATGVNPGEQVEIIFNLQTGKNFDDVFTALLLGNTDGANEAALRIGLHVQSIAGIGGSESFVNTQVPIPAAAWLLGSGLLGLVAIRRRAKK